MLASRNIVTTPMFTLSWPTFAVYFLFLKFFGLVTILIQHRARLDRTWFLQWFNPKKWCVKWINDNSFLVISEFWSEKHLTGAGVYTRPKTSVVFGRLQTSSEDLGLLLKTSDFFGNLRKWSCLLQKSQHWPGIKVSRLYLRRSWQVYWLRHCSVSEQG